VGNIKGTTMIEVVKFLRSRKKEAAPLVPPRLQHYLQSRLLSTSWHPEEDYLELMRVVVKLYKPENPSLTIWEEVARRTNAAYFEGPYKAFVYPGDVARSVGSFPDLWRLRHDTGVGTVIQEGKGRARVELRDYALVANEGCLLVQGTLWGLLEYSGAQGAALVHSRCRARGEPICEWKATWKV
jgi:hypothetical protein